jgi:transposase
MCAGWSNARWNGTPRTCAPRRGGGRAARRRRSTAAERHTEITRLAAAGGTILGNARQLRTSRTTARRYLFADAAPERDDARRPSMLDLYEMYLRRRWAEGCRNGLPLWRELKEQGYPGASRAVSRWAELRREVDPTRPWLGRPRATPAPAGPEPTASPRRPLTARLGWLLVRAPGGLNDENPGLHTRLQPVCPPAETASPLLQQIARLIKERAPERLDGWLERSADCGAPDLVTLAERLRRERAELLAALELPWSTGPVEGQLTRLKLLARQGSGRCGLDTLKRRLVHAA